MSHSRPTSANHLITTLMAIFGILLTAVAPAQESAPLRLIITTDAHVYYHTSEEAASSKPAAAFERQVRELRDLYPDAYLIDAGNLISAANQTETGYSFAGLRGASALSFDAVNLTARDLLFGAHAESGLPAVSDADLTGRLISRLGIKRTGMSGEQTYTLPASLKATRNKRTVTFTSLSEAERLNAFKGARELLVEQDPLAVLSESRKNETPVVALTDMDQAVISRIAASPQRPDVVVAIAGRRDGMIRGDGKASSYIVNAPPVGAVLFVEVAKDKPPVARLHKFLEPPVAAILRTAQTPELGYGIRNAAEILERRFGVEKDSVVETSHAADALTSRTLLRRIFVYEARMGGKERRFYRLNGVMAYFRPEGGATALGMPRYDMVIAIRPEDRTIEKAVLRRPLALRDQFPVAAEDVLNAVAGKSPEAWFVDRARFGGAEDLVDALFSDLRRVIEMDKILYDDTGSARGGS